MNVILKIFFIFITCLSIHLSIIAQQTTTYFFETEYAAGKIVPNYSKNFPSSSVQQALTLSIGKASSDSSGWGKYYRFPETGVSFFASNMGNNAIYGNQFSVLPFVRFKLTDKPTPWFIKLDIGVSYFTTHFDSITNDVNVAIGSSFTWGFQAMLYKTIYQRNKLDLKVFGGYSHNSNGHTQIPNFGLNSALFGISSQFYSKNKSTIHQLQSMNSEKNINYCIQYRDGLGFHELGATSFPVGGEKKLVSTNSFSFGILVNIHVKWKAGFSYRYYQQYYDYIEHHKLDEFKDNVNLNASNIYFFVGTEFLFNHVAIDVEGGLNLYKPFYSYFNDNFEHDDGVMYQLKRWFNARLGLNYYLLNTLINPKHNFFIGTHINANFGQADFTEGSIGYVYVLH